MTFQYIEVLYLHNMQFTHAIRQEYPAAQIDNIFRQTIEKLHDQQVLIVHRTADHDLVKSHASNFVITSKSKK
jgi:hypothetical protein